MGRSPSSGTFVRLVATVVCAVVVTRGGGVENSFLYVSIFTRVVTVIHKVGRRRTRQCLRITHVIVIVTTSMRRNLRQRCRTET